ncbi:MULTISPECIES: signal peptidase II [unclassified Tatumella]|uniref:signal peptidase II n=1 Tax=unclassified Tatumella TaxID=2649542 RepID=UPI001BB04C78|nr:MULTISPECIES: signal peptidase II [unclassified Tatumella]MBS0855289.1 signal peptidase II [Tatumella sp. JGM16]MBS0892811.1 signal peptidase II [Tatumella sp. JGM130]MBS0911846.1 signal peptidase II [Tatumella sp. JGM91]
MSKSLSSTGLRWIWVTVLVMVVDFVSKQWVMADMQLHESRALMPSLNLFYARNYGAAFSFLADKGGWQRWFFAGIAVAIVIALLVMMFRNRASQKMTNIAYAMIIGGAAGNLLDRMWHGFVVDFIDFYVGDWHFATFNLADCAICIGAALVILEGFLPSAAKQADKG